MAKRKDGRKHLLITSMGTDRVGIVEEISEWIFQNGGNIEESRMSRLGAEFASLILVSGDSGLENRLEKTRDTFQDTHNLSVLIKPVHPSPPTPKTPLLRYTLHATSLDHPGIVHQVTKLLRQRSINIASATTRTTLAPFSGTSVFHFHMEIDIPAEVSINKLRTELSELGEQDKIDFVLTAVTEE